MPVTVLLAQEAAGSQALDWGSIKFAEPLATLSAVLAAFVFASIAVLLATPPKEKSEPDFSATVYLFLSVFVCFISSAFFFSVLEALKEGTRLNIVRASLMGTLASYAFWLAGLLIALSLIWLCKVYQLDAGMFRRANFLFRLTMLADALVISESLAKGTSQPCTLAKGIWPVNLWMTENSLLACQSETANRAVSTDAGPAAVFFSLIGLVLLFVLPSLTSGSAVARVTRLFPDAFGTTAAAFQTIGTLSFMFVVFVGGLFTVALLQQDDSLQDQRVQFFVHLALYLPIVLLCVFFTLYDGILRRVELLE